MKRVLVLFLLLASTALAQSGDLGVMLGNIGGSPQKRIEIAKQLGASWYRPEAVLLGLSQPRCDDCEPARAAGLKLVLVVRNSSEEKKPSAAIADVAAFQQQLRTVLEKYKPAIVVVEDEPEDAKSFAGTPEQYAAELKAACDAARTMDIKCTNGGLSSIDMAGVVLAELWKTDSLQAGDFGIVTEVVRAKGSGTSFSVLGRSKNTHDNSREAIQKATAEYIEKHRAEIERASSFLTASASAGTDYANFHWSELKPEEVTTVLDVLGRLNRRPPMSDEMGQTEERAFETAEKIRILRGAHVNPIIWDAVGGKGLVGLVEKNGKPNVNGRAFQAAAQKAQ